MVKKYLDPTVLSLVVIVVIVSLFGYWLVWPNNPIVILDPLNIKTDKTVYTARDRIVYTLSYCKTQQIPETISRELVDGFTIPYASVESNLMSGCRKLLVYDLKIPEFSPSGTYHVSGAVECRINPLRKSIVLWRTEDFQVVNPIMPTEQLEKKIEQNTKDILLHDQEDKAWQRKYEKK